MHQAATAPTDDTDAPSRLLRKTFGLHEFRQGQQDVIDRLIAGRNVAAVFPTGGGKSLCYQLPSQILGGLTVVVSPLIALMKDQCDALATRGIPAARLDSNLPPDVYRAHVQGIRDGSIKILYASPERFFNERFIALIKPLGISLFAIDEAHCISQWGHNFRPDYLKLAGLARELDAERILALTATATPEVLNDIRNAFDIHVDDAIRTPFHRPNLEIRSQVTDRAGHYPTLLDRLETRPRGPTLIYVSQQRTAEQLAGRLTGDGLEATAYHAGLPAEERDRVQSLFIPSSDAIVVATIAFGMGIDKPDLRYVYHANPPKSLEAYAQEIGRAGRDSEPAICEMLLVPEDRIVLENFTYGDTPSRHAIGRLIDDLSSKGDVFFLSHYKLASLADIRVLVVRTLLTYLELAGYLKATSPRYDSYKIKPLVPSAEILKQLPDEQRRFVAGVLSCLTKGRTWFTLNMAVAMERVGADRERILRAVDHLAERQWVEIKAADLVHGYRWQRRIDDRDALAGELHERLVSREQGETRRLDDVLKLACAASCQAAALAKHFGERLAQPCGQCSACRGEGPFEIPPVVPPAIDPSVIAQVDRLAEEHPEVLALPRDRARFLCGLSSPGLVRAKLTRDPMFGRCESVPFARVMAQLNGDPDTNEMALAPT